MMEVDSKEMANQTFWHPSMDSSDCKVIWSPSAHTLFSKMYDGMLSKRYSPWLNYKLEVCDNATISCAKANDRSGKNIHVFDVTVVSLEKIVVLDNESGGSGVGVRVQCKEDGLDTSFRILLSVEDLDHFSASLMRVATFHNIPSFRSSSVQVDAITSKKGVYQIESYRFSFIRTNVIRNIDKVEKKNLKSVIVSRRGAFASLPVLFANDLVHGSWWFVLGSLLTTLVGSVTLYNAYTNFIGEDDSHLTEDSYRVAWSLVIASGLFMSAGSLAFVRAMSDPPMKPMFRWYHFSSDELFGSWMFFLAMLPAVPYSLIYLAVYEEMIYLVMLGLSVAGVFATFLFVWSCYPSQVGQGKNYSRMLPCLLCLFCRSRFVRKHFATDWLIACWAIFHSTLWSTLAFFVFSVYSASYGANGVTNFINVTTLFECFIFLVGSAYFVAGSYPSPSVSEGLTLIQATLNNKRNPVNSESLICHDSQGGLMIEV